MQFNQRHDYEYPNGLDLRPDSPVHEKLLDAAKDRIKRGYETGSDMREMWRKLDHLQTAYVPTTTDSIWELKKDSKAPVDVVIPVSRAFLDMLVSYTGGIYLGDPTGLYQLTARGDKEQLVRAAKMEALLNTQAHWFKHKLSHYTGFRDAYLYGISVKSPVWAKHKRREAIQEEVSEVLYQMVKDTVPGIGIGDMVRYLEERVYHEGNEIENIDPYSLILDPYVRLNHYQKAEFLGYWHRTHIMDLLKRESDPEERMFNAKYVRELVDQRCGRSEIQWANQSGRYDRIGMGTETEIPGHPSTQTTNEVDLAHLYWNLIPEEWDLGDSTDPELYEITVAGDEVIIQCNRLDYDHGMYPLVMSGPNTCGYDLLPISGIAATYGMHQLIDWKVRTHWWNASKVQNDMFVVDGSAVNVQDFMRPGPGKIIRLKRPLYGDKNIDQFIKQLQVTDVTGNYLQDIQGVHDLINVVLGTHDIMAGNMSGMPERPTAFGLQAAQSNAMSRIQMYAEMLGEQEWYTLITQMAHNNVQYLQNDMVVNILGSRFEEQLRMELGVPAGINDITVGPWDLDMGAFEIMPVSRLQKETDMSIMSQMMDRMLSIPEVALEAFGGMDVSRMFLAMIRKMGFANVHEFRREGGMLPPVNPMVMPDEQVMAMEQAGNVMPAPAAGMMG
jgi:hypothetical protein